jgi:hypothetical protein
MPSRNCKTRPLSWRIAANEQLAQAVKAGGWVVSWIFVNIIASVDNAGRMEGGKNQLKDMFFPHHDITLDEIEQAVGLLHDYGLIIRYSIKSTINLIQLPKFGKYVVIKGNASLESDFPPPTEQDIKGWEDTFKEKFQHVNIVKPEVKPGNPKCYQVVEYWNSHPNLPQCRFLSAKRQDQLNLRWKSAAFRENYKAAIDKVVASRFCNGDNTYGWTATFDWFIKNDDNWAKAMEGKYDGKQQDIFAKY